MVVEIIGKRVFGVIECFNAHGLAITVLNADGKPVRLVYPGQDLSFREVEGREGMDGLIRYAILHSDTLGLSVYATRLLLLKQVEDPLFLISVSVRAENAAVRVWARELHEASLAVLEAGNQAEARSTPRRRDTIVAIGCNRIGV